MASVLELRLTGGADNTDPDASLGGVSSSTEISATPLNNLFDDISPSEAEAGDIEYRALSIYNSGDASAVGIELWFESNTTSDDTDVAIGVDSGTQTIANEGTAPNDPTITFTAPTSGSPLSLTDIAASGARRIWIRRTCGASAVNHNNDEFELAIRYA